MSAPRRSAERAAPGSCWRLHAEHVRCGRQSLTRAVDQEGGIKFRLEGARSLIVSGFGCVEEDFDEGVWPVDLQVVVGVGDVVQAVAARLEHQVLVPYVARH